MSKLKTSIMINYRSELAAKHNGWENAILAAESEIEDAKGRVAGLKRSIAIFKKLRDKGMPFPSQGEGDASTHAS